MSRDKRRYEYAVPSYDDTVERAERKKGGDYSIFKEGVKEFKAKQGSNLVRILPMPKSAGSHFGLFVKVHRNVGPKNYRYLCLRDKNSPYKRCPVCEFLYELGSKASKDEKYQYTAVDRVVYYVLERDNEKEGVQVWETSLRNDSEIASQCTNTRNKSIINIVDPDEGYDVEFTRVGEKLKTEYRGFKVVRESSPLTDNDKKFDEFLDVAFDEPLPSILQFYKPEYIEGVLYGRVKEEEDEGDEEEDKTEMPKRRRLREVEVSEDKQQFEPVFTQGDDPRPRTSLEEGYSPRTTTQEERPKSRRTRLQEDLDDEIPFDTKSNGEDVEDRPKRRVNSEPEKESERVSRPKRRLTEEDEIEEEKPKSRRNRVQEEEDEEERPPLSELRQKMRERINRERD